MNRLLERLERWADQQAGWFFAGMLTGIVVTVLALIR